MRNLFKRALALIAAGCVVAANGVCFAMPASAAQGGSFQLTGEFVSCDELINTSGGFINLGISGGTLQAGWTDAPDFAKTLYSGVTLTISDDGSFTCALPKSGNGKKTSGDHTDEDILVMPIPAITFTGQIKDYQGGIAYWNDRDEVKNYYATATVTPNTWDLSRRFVNEYGEERYHNEVWTFNTESSGASMSTYYNAELDMAYVILSVDADVVWSNNDFPEGQDSYDDASFYFSVQHPAVADLRTETDSSEESGTVGGGTQFDSSSEDDSLWIIQNESRNALESAGEDSGTEIDAELVTGKKKHRDDDSSDNAKKGAAAATGAAVAAVTAATSVTSSRKKKVIYKMYINKDFGDTVEPGEKYTVYARIVQIHTGTKQVREADELTSKIIAFSNELQVNYHYDAATHRMAAEFDVNEDNGSKAALSFRLTGKGGVFTETVTFKVRSFEKIMGIMYVNSDGTIGEIFEPHDDIRTHGLFLGENVYSTVYVFTGLFRSMPEVTAVCDTAMLSPVVTPMEKFAFSPTMDIFMKSYPRYSYLVNCNFFRVDLNNRTGKPTSIFGKYPLNTNVTFIVRSKRNHTLERVMPVAIIPKGFFVDLTKADERQRSHDHIDLYTNELIDANRSKIRPTVLPVFFGFVYKGYYRNFKGYHENNRKIPVERVIFDNAFVKDEYTSVSPAAQRIKLKKDVFFRSELAGDDNTVNVRGGSYSIDYGWRRDEGHYWNNVPVFRPVMPVLVDDVSEELLFDLKVYYKAMDSDTGSLFYDLNIETEGSVPVRIYGEPRDSGLYERVDELRKIDRIIKLMDLEKTDAVRMLTDNANEIKTDDLNRIRRWIFDYGYEYQDGIYKENVLLSAEYSECIAYLTGVKWCMDTLFTAVLKYYCQVHKPAIDEDMAEAVVIPLKTYLEDLAADYSVSYIWQTPMTSAFHPDRFIKAADSLIETMLFQKPEQKKLIKLLVIAGLYKTLMEMTKEYFNNDSSENYWWRVTKNVFKNMTKASIKLMIGKYILPRLSEEGSEISKKIEQFLLTLQKEVITNLVVESADFCNELMEYANDLELTDDSENYYDFCERMASKYGTIEIQGPDGKIYTKPKIVALLLYPDKLLKEWQVENLKPLFDYLPEIPAKLGYLSPKETREIMDHHGMDTSGLALR